MRTDKNKRQMSVEPERNIMGKATEIKGDIVSQGDIRIDGTFEGTIKTSGKLILGQEAKVKGHVECVHADIEGFYNGRLECSGMLTIKSTAKIDGEILVEKLAIEPGAVFNATCQMKGVKSLNSDVENKQSKKEIS